MMMIMNRYQRERQLRRRIETISQATGIGNRQPEKGIAGRLDAIEDKQAELEERIAALEEE